MERLQAAADAGDAGPVNDVDAAAAKHKLEKLPPPPEYFKAPGEETGSAKVEQQVNIISSDDEDAENCYYGPQSLAAGSDFPGFESHNSTIPLASDEIQIDEIGGRGDADVRLHKSTGVGIAKLKKRASVISLRDTNVGGDNDFEMTPVEMEKKQNHEEDGDDASSFSGQDNIHVRATIIDSTAHLREPQSALETSADQIVEINSNSTTKSQREKRQLRNNKVQLYLNQQQLQQQQQQQATVTTTPNTQHKCSTESTSEFPVSSPSNPHPPGGGNKYPQRSPLLKNTLPADSFERQLALIAARNPQMTLDDKMRAWRCDAELSDVEDVNNFDDLFKKREEYKRKASSGKNRRGAVAPSSSQEIAKDSLSVSNDAQLFAYDFVQFRAMMLKNINSPQGVVTRQKDNNAGTSNLTPTNADKDNKPCTSAAAHLAAQRRLKAAAEVETATRKRAQKAAAEKDAGGTAKKTQQHSTTPPATSSSDENDVECYPPGPKKKLKATTVDAKKTAQSSSTPQKILVYEKVLCPSSSEETSQEAITATPPTVATKTPTSQRDAAKDAKTLTSEQSPTLLTPQLHWATTTDEDSVFRLHRLNREIDKLDDRDTSPGDGGGLIQMRLDFIGEKKNLHLKDKRNELFKTPTIPQKYLLTHSELQQSDKSADSHKNSATVASASPTPESSPHSQELLQESALSTSPEGAAFHRQHEFCNYLGLTGMSTANAVASALAELDKCNLARRSLRVRHMQHQDRSEKKEKKERKVRKDKKEKNSNSTSATGKEEDDGKVLEALKMKQLHELKRREKGGAEVLAVVLQTSARDDNDTEGKLPHASKREATTSPTTTTATANATAKSPTRHTTTTTVTVQHNGGISKRSPSTPPPSFSTPPPQLSTVSPHSPRLSTKEPEIKILCHISAKSKEEAEKVSKEAVKQITAPIRQSLMRHLKREKNTNAGLGATTCSSSNGTSTCARSSVDGNETPLELSTLKRLRLQDMAAAAVHTPTTNTRSRQLTQRNECEGTQPQSATIIPIVPPPATPALLNQFQEYLKESRQTKPSIYIVQSLTSDETLTATVTNQQKPLIRPSKLVHKSNVTAQTTLNKTKNHPNMRKRLSNGALPRNSNARKASTTKRRLHKLLTRSTLNMSQQRQLRSRRIVLLKTLQRSAPKRAPSKAKEKSTQLKVTATSTSIATKPISPVREHLRSATPLMQRDQCLRKRKENKVTVGTDAPSTSPQLSSMSPTMARRRMSPQVLRNNHSGQSRPKLLPPITTDESDLNSKETTILKTSAPVDTLSAKVVAKAQQNASSGDANTVPDPDAVVVSSTTNSYDETALLNVNNSAMIASSNTKELHKNVSFIVDSGSGSRSAAASRSIVTKDSATQSFNISTAGCGIRYLANPPSIVRSLQNPLKSENGPVLYIYYEMDVLIAVQEALVSFWKYSKLINVLVGQHPPQKSQSAQSVRISEPTSSEWVHLGECRHMINDTEIDTPYANRICIHNSIPIYIEMRCRELPQDRRECNLLSMYINIYYYHDEEMHAKMHSIQLDSVQSMPRNVIFTTITESRYFVMSWPQENILGKIRSGLCKYSLTPHLDTLASIREFKSMRHEIRYLECTDDDKLLGFGNTQLTIWDHRSGDVLMNYDLDFTLGRNMGSIYYPSLEIGQQNVILLFQYMQSGTEPAELIVIACSISHVVPTHRILQRHRLPSPAFNDIISAINTGEHLLLTARSDEEIWISCVDPNVITCVPAQHTQRFFARGSTQLIELTTKSLTVDSFANHVLKMAASGGVASK